MNAAYGAEFEKHLPEMIADIDDIDQNRECLKGKWTLEKEVIKKHKGAKTILNRPA